MRNDYKAENLEEMIKINVFKRNPLHLGKCKNHLKFAVVN